MTPEQLRAYANTLANEEADVFNEHAALLERHAELEKIAEELSLWCIDSAAHKAFMAWRDAK